MSPKEIRLALGVLDTRERLIFRMAVFDGMRPGEILAIRLGNISEQSVLIDQRAYKATSTLRRAEKVSGPHEPWAFLLARLRS